MMIAENLNEDGVFCPMRLKANEAMVCFIPTTTDVMMSTGGVKIKAYNCRMQKQITFRFKNPNFTNVVSGTDINVAGQTTWLCAMKMCPIIR